MVADVLFTVAIVAPALGTVAEFQLRIGYISPAADSAAMRVIGLGVCLWRVGACCFKLDNLGLLRLLLSLDHAGCFDPPGSGEDIQHILSKEQEIVCYGNHREEIVGEGKGNQINQDNCQIHQCKQPGFHRNDEEQKKLGIRIQRRVAQEQTQIQVCHTGLTTEDHAVDIHHNNAADVKKVKPQRSPVMFHNSADGVVAVQGDQHQDGIGDLIGQGIGNKPPNLPLENG